MSDLVFGLTITAIGMGLVFGLLVLLWGALALLGKLDAVLPATDEAEDATPAAGAAAGAVVVRGGELDPEVIAAVALAVSDHAALLRRQAAPGQRSSKPGARLFASRWLAAGRTRQTRSFRRGR